MVGEEEIAAKVCGFLDSQNPIQPYEATAKKTITCPGLTPLRDLGESAKSFLRGFLKLFIYYY